MSKPAPSFWWDFTEDCGHVIVQSDYPGGDCLAKFPTEQLSKAEELIDDFKSGRKIPNWDKP